MDVRLAKDVAETTETADEKPSRAAELRAEFEALEPHRNPERAAAILGELLATPASEDDASPSPEVCLEVALELLARSRTEDAEHLVVVIEERFVAKRTRHEIAPEFTRKLTFANELLTLAPFTTKPVIETLARAVLKGDMGLVRGALRTEMPGTDRGWPKLFARKAPWLFAATEHHLPARWSRTGHTKNKPRAKITPARWIAVACGVLLAIATKAYDSSNHGSSRRAAPLDPAVVAAHQPPAMPSPNPVDPEVTKPLVEHFESLIEQALAKNDCSAAGQRWPDYLLQVRRLPPADVKSTRYLALQKQALEKCREFSALFADLP